MDTLFVFLSVVVLDIVLSGDNALVVAMVANKLPEQDRDSAINLGMFYATILRIVFLLFASLLLHFRLFTIIGGLFLLWIDFKLVLDLLNKGDKLDPEVKDTPNKAAAIGAIIMADVSMSLDNVLAVAGLAHQHIILMCLGIGLSILLLTKASKWICTLLDDAPWLNWVGVALILFAAIKLLW